MNELINYEAVYRTAPATPGLLKILLMSVNVDKGRLGGGVSKCECKKFWPLPKF